MSSITYVRVTGHPWYPTTTHSVTALAYIYNINLMIRYDLEHDKMSHESRTRGTRERT